uniref:LEM domain-containing protein n=1 Tax=Mola mola TaxID=94237 RepID=A0A3Q3WQM7_MOLML
MSSLSNMSAQEISELLDEYGIKHGPVVDTTRSLYERKLKEAMSKGRKGKPSLDKTYYREEGNLTTICTVLLNSSSSSELYNFTSLKSKHICCFYVNTYRSYTYDTPSTYRNSYLKSTPMKPTQDTPTTAKSSSFVPLWVQIVFFLAVAIFLYLVFSNMETNESFNHIQ